MAEREGFPNMTGASDPDETLAAELTAAGITVHRLSEILRSRDEVETIIVGEIHGWHFTRAWYYWRAKGHGLPPTYANPLHEANGQEVRVAGHCGCPSPLEWCKGFAVGDYHIDTRRGLLALANALKQCVADATPPREIATDAGDA